MYSFATVCPCARHDLVKKMYELKDTNSELAALLLDQVLNTWMCLFSLLIKLVLMQVLIFLLAFQIYDNAMITAGLNDDPRPMISRLNELLTKALEKH